LEILITTGDSLHGTVKYYYSGNKRSFQALEIGIWKTTLLRKL